MKENKINQNNPNERHAKANAIAFLTACGCFLAYWIAFLIMGLAEKPSNFPLYLFFITLELIVLSLIIATSIVSLRKKNHDRYELFFTVNWVLLAIATFPLPFAYLFSAPSSTISLNNEVAAMGTPTTILTILSLFFACAAYEKYHEDDIKAHKLFAQLMVGSLFAAVVYVFGCMIFKIAKNTNPAGQLTTIYYYVGLAVLYIALCIYASIRTRKEALKSNESALRTAPDPKRSLFGIANAIYFVYGLINLIIDCYTLANAFQNDVLTLSVRYGRVDSSLLLGDSIFLFMTHIAMVIYAFLLIHDRHKEDQRDPLFSLCALGAMFAVSYAVTSLVGGYGMVTAYLDSPRSMSDYIISNFGIITFSVVAFATALAGMFSSSNDRYSAALFMLVSSFLTAGIVISLFYGEISVLAKGIINVQDGVLSLVRSFPDFAIMIITILAIAREFPPKAKQNE